MYQRTDLKMKFASREDAYSYVLRTGADWPHPDLWPLTDAELETALGVLRLILHLGCVDTLKV